MTFPLSITEVHSCFTFDLNEITDSCADTEKQNNQTITIYFKLQLKIKPVKVVCSTPSTPQASRCCIMSKRDCAVTGTDLIPPTGFWTRPASCVCPQLLPLSLSMGWPGWRGRVVVVQLV